MLNLVREEQGLESGEPKLKIPQWIPHRNKTLISWVCNGHRQESRLYLDLIGCWAPGVEAALIYKDGITLPVWSPVSAIVCNF